MGSRYFRHRLGEGEEINIAPLIDMVFILLIFFMVSTTFVRDVKIDLERPGAKMTQTADNRSLRVTLGRRGELFIDDQPVKPWMLQSRVRELLARNRIKTVLVVVDQRVDSGKLVEVVDQCRIAGARDVGVAVDQEL
jgi:biopolymer transport protein ExbD